MNTFENSSEEKSKPHILVVIDYSPNSIRLLRWSKEFSLSIGAQLQALFVETAHKVNANEHDQLEKNINLAKQLGINVRITTNNNEVKAIVDYAQKEKVTHIMIGKPPKKNILSIYILKHFLNRLILYSGDIDVCILGSDRLNKNKYINKVTAPSFTSSVKQYSITAALVILSSLICYTIKDVIGYQVVSFVLLFLVSMLALFFGIGPILLAALLSAFIWDVFFIPPQFTIHIENPVDVLMLVMFFIIALLNGILTSRIKRQEKRIRIREERTNALYQLTKDLTSITGYNEVTMMATNYIQKYFKIECIIILKDEYQKLNYQDQNNTNTLNENELEIANLVYIHSFKAGKYTSTLPSSEFTFYPLQGNSGNMGVIAIKHTEIFTHGEDQFWEACLSQISGKYEREFLREAAKKAYLISESEKLYKTLFNSISHELRIPVATIMGASDTLLTQAYPEETQIKLYNEINTASIRLNRLIENLLNMSRLESGHITSHADWCDVNDLANEVSESLKIELKPFVFLVLVPSNMPLVYIDYGLIEQALHNLVLNATQHSPAGSTITLKFFFVKNLLSIQVMDRGPGFPDTELSSVFNKFYRGKDSKTGGTGLGLSIVKGYIEAHNGSVIAENSKNGGAIITIQIPLNNSENNTFNNTEENNMFENTKD